MYRLACMLAVILPSIALLLGCAAQTASTNGVAIESELRQHMNGPAKILVVKAVNNKYYALPTSGIKEIVQNQIVLEEGTVIARGSGDGNEQVIARTLIQQLSRGSDSFSFTQNSQGQLVSAGSTETVGVNAVIKVKRIVSSTAN